MSKKSNEFGRAYEYCFIVNFRDRISKEVTCHITNNTVLQAAKEAYLGLSEYEKLLFEMSVKSTFNTIFQMEPRILDKDDKDLTLTLQQDKAGENGDVRDILINREILFFKEKENWEIGLSLKHNNDAVKHSRLSAKLDFGNKWYGEPCSREYKEEIKPVFYFLKEKKKQKVNFEDIVNKEEIIYIPLLQAFIKELKRAVQINPEIPKRLVQYLLSRYDFYKIISLDTRKMTAIESFNLYGKLNQPSNNKKPSIIVPKIQLPEKILFLDLKPDSTNTVILCFDNGWQFSFRIHNAEKVATPSLKFDIRIVGMPAELSLKKLCPWEMN